LAEPVLGEAQSQGTVGLWTIDQTDDVAPLVEALAAKA
jgi:hypothetical protein